MNDDKKHDELPATCLSGLQVKVHSELTSGRYIGRSPVNLDPIPSKPASPIVSERARLSESEMAMRRFALQQAEASNRLEGLERAEAHRDLDEKWVRGEMTADEVADEVLRRYHTASDGV